MKLFTLRVFPKARFYISSSFHALKADPLRDIFLDFAPYSWKENLDVILQVLHEFLEENVGVVS